MIKKIITSAILVLLLGFFGIFIHLVNSSKEVLQVISPTKFDIDTNADRIIGRKLFFKKDK